MKFVTSREVRNNPSKFRSDVGRDDVVLTVDGKPFAVAVGIQENEMEETLDMLRRLRALRGMRRMQMRAAESGASAMTQEDIDQEIGEVRKSRRSK